MARSCFCKGAFACRDRQQHTCKAVRSWKRHGVLLRRTSISGCRVQAAQSLWQQVLPDQARLVWELVHQHMAAHHSMLYTQRVWQTLSPLLSTHVMTPSRAINKYALPRVQACRSLAKGHKRLSPGHAVEVLHGPWRKDDVCSLPVFCDHERSAPRLKMLADELQQGQDLAQLPDPALEQESTCGASNTAKQRTTCVVESGVSSAQGSWGPHRVVCPHHEQLLCDALHTRSCMLLWTRTLVMAAAACLSGTLQTKLCKTSSPMNSFDVCQYQAGLLTQHLYD